MSLILLSNLTRHAHTPSKTNATAFLQQTALYTRRHKRGREHVQFPWVWPSEAESALKRPPTPMTRLSGAWHRLYVGTLGSVSGISLAVYMFKNVFFAKKICDEMIPLVLSRIADTINKRDYEQMDELMTPYLAKLYKHVVANLDAQGFQIKLEIDAQRSGARNDYMWIRQGDPEAHDYAIPFTTRNSKYVLLKTEKLVIAVEKNRDGTIRHGKSSSPISGSWFGLELGFVVNANVKVELYKGKRIVDCDSGIMPIPIAISTPHYHGLSTMANAVSGGEGSASECPFRWRVCDLFYVADWNNANDIAQANEKNS